MNLQLIPTLLTRLIGTSEGRFVFISSRKIPRDRCWDPIERLTESFVVVVLFTRVVAVSTGPDCITRCLAGSILSGEQFSAGSLDMDDGLTSFVVVGAQRFLL